MKAKDIIIGFVVLVALVAGIVYVKNLKKNKVSTPVPTPNYQQVEGKFPGLKVPENADRANLVAPSGKEGIGEAFRTSQNGKLSLTVMADLPSPKSGYFYQGWIVKGGSQLSLGKMSLSKGGYIVEFNGTGDYLGYDKVVITEEKVFNSTPETTVLEGSF